MEATLPSPQDNSCEKEETAQTYVNELFDNLRAEFKYMQWKEREETDFSYHYHNRKEENECR